MFLSRWWYELLFFATIVSCAPPVLAQEQSIVVGRPVNKDKPFLVELFVGEGNGHVNSVVVHNEYNFYSLLDEDYSVVVIGNSPPINLTIRESSDQKAKDGTPLTNNLDVVEVKVPEGYVAIPTIVEIDEGGSATIEIYKTDEVPLG